MATQSPVCASNEAFVSPLRPLEFEFIAPMSTITSGNNLLHVRDVQDPGDAGPVCRGRSSSQGRKQRAKPIYCFDESIAPFRYSRSHAKKTSKKSGHTDIR